MRCIANAAATVADREYRVVPFGNRDPRDDVGETQCPAIGRKLEQPRNLKTIVAKRPILVYGGQQLAGLLRRQGLGTAVAGLAALAHKIIVHVGSIEKNRPRRAGLPEQFGPGGDSR